jgi:ABC-type transporter Mla MlaB component
MTTTKTPTYLEVDPDNAIRALQGVGEKLASGDETILNFSRVMRIEPGALRALEALAQAASEAAAKITLRSVNVEVYKVLKLARVASRFSFER